MPPTLSYAPAPPAALSFREHELMRLLAQGKPNKVIAGALSLSTETVKTHVKHIFKKLGVTNRTEAALRYLEAQRTFGQ